MKKQIWYCCIALLMLTALPMRSLSGSDLPSALLDQWFVGYMNGAPILQAHGVVSRNPDNTSIDTFEMVVLIARKLGNKTITYESREAQKFEVDAHGQIRSFNFDHLENEAVTAAAGRIEDNKVLGTIVRLGRSEPVALEIPAGESLLGQQASQKVLAARVWKLGDKHRFLQLALLNGRLLIIHNTATFQGNDAQGHLIFEVIADEMPVPMGTTITAAGELVSMKINFGMFAIDIVSSAGPVKLAGAELDPARLVTARGPAPSALPVHRYRLPVGATVAQDEFQQQIDTDVTVRSETTPQVLADASVYLAREAQLEIDDPALRAWVESIIHGQSPLGLAERLRLAVRSYISVKDLSQGDASALETFRSKRGDCTEHANLLCAALRIAGIPARVEIGIVYSPIFGGWVGHAWNSAYVTDDVNNGATSGRWIHLDSAYPGIERSCYLKLGTNSGTSWTDTGAALIGNLSKLGGKTVETLP